MTEPVVGRLAYGTYWKITDEQEAYKALYQALLDEGKVSVTEDDLELGDLVDTLIQHYDAQASYDSGYTLYFGHIITDLSTAENKFDEMALVRTMDLTKGVLHPELREKVKKLIETIPYGLRSNFKRPQFFIAWGVS